jgi:hypothetical protein
MGINKCYSKNQGRILIAKIGLWGEEKCNSWIGERRLRSNTEIQLSKEVLGLEKSQGKCVVKK